MLSISVLIPLTGKKEIQNTIASVIRQEYEKCEILILRNGIADLPEGLDVKEGEINFISKIPIRELLIRNRGKGIALNIGIRKSTYEYICVLDADCVLEQHAFTKAIKHFEDADVSAIGGRLKAINEKRNMIVFLQKIEYMKTFNIWRSLVNRFNATYLISGAYGMFRKSDIELVNGYDIDTVGEDMEVVLSIQELLRGIGRKVFYEKDSICYTGIPDTMHKLLRQRDRWQRGLLDNLIKHRRLIFNPKYGLLGCAVIPCEVIFQLLSPIFIILNVITLIFAELDFERYFIAMETVRVFYKKQYWILYFLYLIFQMFLTCHAEYLDCRKWYVYITMIPKAAAAVVLGSLLSVPLAIARLWGMVSFHWRRMVW